MNEINYIIIILAILFIIERKAINILIAYIGLLVSIAIKIPQEEYIRQRILTLTTPEPHNQLTLTSRDVRRISPLREDITLKEESPSNPLESLLNEKEWLYTQIVNKIKIDTLEKIDGEYYSYIIILVQVSALSILFGFIIMLYPNITLIPYNPLETNLPTSTTLIESGSKVYRPLKGISKLRNYTNNLTNLSIPLNGVFISPEVKEMIKKEFQKGITTSYYVREILSILLLVLIYLYNIQPSISYGIFNNPISSGGGLTIPLQSTIVEAYNYLTSTIYDGRRISPEGGYSSWGIPKGDNLYVSIMDDIPREDSRGILIRKIGKGFYTATGNIIKLMLLTLILLIAIIVLFYLI